jgi:60 kDa SS-A/Ro ribonucleoprotein
MASLNKPTTHKRFTHEGAPASSLNPRMELERTIMACLLWENNFYEDGVSVADRIKALISKVSTSDLSDLAIKTRNEMKLRHVPLIIAREMARHPGHKKAVAFVLSEIIQRPDELTEFLSLYWQEKRQPLSGQVKKGLALAFKKFNEYSLAKYNRDNAVKLRDVLFLCHPKPKDKEQQEVWDRLVKGELKTPDTWEVELSAKGNNKESWERMLSEKKLGALALLRNLRNMMEAGVAKQAIRVSLSEIKTERVLPFRFIAAARYAPDFEPELESAMYKCVAGEDKIGGATAIVVDVSGSMDSKLSEKGEMLRTDAAYGLAVLGREMFSDVEIFSFSNQVVKLPPRRGFALRDSIHQSQPHGGTLMGQAIAAIQQHGKYDRIIAITDEQSADVIPAPNCKGYIINVACYQNGVGYGPWTHINGWSESVLRFIQESEKAARTKASGEQICPVGQTSASGMALVEICGRRKGPVHGAKTESRNELQSINHAL